MIFGPISTPLERRVFRGQCAWPSLFGAYLQEAFPNSVQLISYARGKEKNIFLGGENGV